MADGDEELGPCVKCDHGWVTVGPNYVHEQAQLPDPEARVQVADADHEAWLAQRAAALRSTIYPCRVCRPAAFMRWAKGYPAEVEGDGMVRTTRRRRSTR